MTKKVQLSRNVWYRPVLSVVLAVSIVVLLGENLKSKVWRESTFSTDHHQHSDPELVPELVPVPERLVTEPEQEPKPEPKLDPLFVLPQSEQNLYQKAIETNYSGIWMAPVEVNMLLRYIDGKQRYLEWGSGGSTMNFPRWVSKAVSIEHDAKWCSQMKKKISENEQLAHVDYHCVPVPRGKGGWGLKSAFEEGNYTVFRDYINEIDNVGGLFDFVLIDGRARVDCAMKALSYIKNSSIVVLHDASRLWGRGYYYREVKKWYSLIHFLGGEGEKGIAILKRKPEFAKYEGNHEAVQQLLDIRYPLPFMNETAELP